MKKGFKILHINTAYTWEDKEEQLYYLAKGLKEMEHEIIITAPPKSDLSNRYEQAGVSVYPIRMRGEFDFFALYKLTKFIKKENIQIVHLHDYHAHTLGAIAAKLAKTSKVVASIYADPHIQHYNLRRFMCKLPIDTSITDYEYIKDSLVKHRIRYNKINVISDGVDIQKFNTKFSTDYLYKELKIKRRNPLIGVIAPLIPYKDYENFLHAASLVCEKKPHTQFLIIGEGSLQKTIETLIKKLDLIRNVKLIGLREDIPQILSILDMYVCSSYAEGICTLILEAMASGLPIVATKVGGIPELIEDKINGLLVPPKNSKALAKGIISLLTDKELAKTMKIANKEKANEFSFVNMINKTEKIYHKVMKTI